ncbi:hypothetical protein BD289DRAFT_65402 [Coniella lustricola]|uniref:Uncharacterized protein n=1 Tax=Coniella lustricola TaxID=2025994 RepID=A0A2T3AHX9_9PEZI|nr:hypothetical protein BD289DRAFT_65402 [Coniella lustricola]
MLSKHRLFPLGSKQMRISSSIRQLYERTVQGTQRLILTLQSISNGMSGFLCPYLLPEMHNPNEPNSPSHLFDNVPQRATTCYNVLQRATTWSAWQAATPHSRQIGWIHLQHASRCSGLSATSCALCISMPPCSVGDTVLHSVLWIWISI